MGINILKDFEVLEISLVNEPAVMEDFLILKQKNKEDKMADNLVEKITKNELDKEPKTELKVEEEVKPAVEEEIVKALKSENNELVIKLKAFEEKEKEAIYKSKAEKLSNLDNGELVGILKAVNENLNKDIADKIMNLFTRLNSVVEKSILFKEVGSSANEASPNTVEDVEVIAKARAEKEGITFEKAFLEEIMKNKQIYEGGN